MALIAAHADWSVDPRKRWAVVARKDGATWQVEAPRPVVDPAGFAQALLAEGAPAALGLDLPLGVPRGYAAQRPEAGFLPFLAARAGDTRFFTVNPMLDGVTLDAPFYPARGVKGMTRAAHAAALGLDGPRALNRWCDAATALRPAGAPVFWTLGANQSGKAAIAAWRDWLAPALAAGAPLDLWPFAGGLHALLRRGRLAVAEVYPAEALRQLGLRLAGSKRSQAPRRALAAALAAAMDALGAEPTPALRAALEDGFGADAAGEDRLDATLGVLALIAVLDGRRADHIPDDGWVRRWEGWVLGQAELPRERP
ncbi:MAG: DUF429 domain-containing protein [Rubritepida sp.]|nr:DUF429 domain-containing protein [Rubritepida sp.]